MGDWLLSSCNKCEKKLKIYIISLHAMIDFIGLFFYFEQKGTKRKVDFNVLKAGLWIWIRPSFGRIRILILNRRHIRFWIRSFVLKEPTCWLVKKIYVVYRFARFWTSDWSKYTLGNAFPMFLYRKREIGGCIVYVLVCS